MKKLVWFMSILGSVILLLACSSDPSNTYTISGYLFESTKVQDPDAPNLEDREGGTEKLKMDLSTATISIRQKVDTDNGEIQLVEMKSGKFVNGKVKLQGTVNEITEIEVAVALENGELMTTDAVIGPDSLVSFALIEVSEPEPDRLLLFGASRNAIHPDRKFTISGELQSIIPEGALAVAEVTSRSWNEKGESLTRVYGTAMLRDRSFVIEADINEPTVMDITVDILGRQYPDGHFSGVAVVEPISKVEVIARGSSNDLQTTSESQLHSTLIETWQKNEEYQSKMDRGQILQKEFIASLDLGQAVAGNTEANATVEDSSDSSETSSESEGSSTQDVVLGMPLDAGCEHVDLSAVVPSIEESYEPPKFRILWDEAWQIRVDTLEEIALDSDDPWLILLALELGAFNYYFGDLDHAMRIHEELELKLPEDVARRRLKPKRDLLASYLQYDELDMKVVPGQKAPAFTLPDLQGADIDIRDVLTDNDLVYIDFWASWCGPCIATFPALKNLYASYKDRGFEIVVISIDESHEEWEVASLEQDLPWLNVADIGGFDQETPLAYGVQFIPKAFLVDSKGCIVQKNLATNKLEEILAQQYGS